MIGFPPSAGQSALGVASNRRGTVNKKQLACPSAPADAEDARVFGVIGGTVAEPRLAYLAKDVAVTDEMLVTPEGISPTRIFRFTGGCVEGRCQQFSNGVCSLGKNIDRMLSPVVDQIPACTIRGSCRWYAENGPNICLKCPQVVTTLSIDDDALRSVVASSGIDDGSDVPAPHEHEQAVETSSFH